MKGYHRTGPIAASIAIQLCLGIAYIWSVFQTGVANSIFGGDNAAASLAFSLLLSTLTVGSVIGGKLAARYSTRTIVIIGGVILSAGFLLASFATRPASVDPLGRLGVTAVRAWDLPTRRPSPARRSGFPDKKRLS